MTKFADSNDKIYLVDSPPYIHDELPVGFYGLRRTPDGELYLERIKPFAMPSELFGDVDTMARRVINTFNDRSGTTGLLLSGEKGSGKTLLGKKIAIDKHADGQPVIVVNFPVDAAQFGTFLQKINQPVTLFFDEFEKIYDANSQNGLLTLLDGVYPVRILAILTTNDNSRMVGPLLDRPGRIYYKIDYAGLPYAFIMEYATKKLKNHDFLPEVGRLAALVELNFDQLQALIEEMNRYNEPASEAVQYLNISVEPKSHSMKIISMSNKGGTIPKEHWYSDFCYEDLNIDEDCDPLYFHYTVANEAKISYQDMDADSDAYEHSYAMRSKWGNKLSARYEEALTALPQVMAFQHDDMDIDVRANGHIVLTNAVGDEIILQRMAASFKKTF